MIRLKSFRSTMVMSLSGTLGLFLLLLVGSVRAQTFLYESNPLDLGGRLFATVELSCNGPCGAGVYREGAGLTAFSMSAILLDSSVLFTASSLDSAYPHVFGESGIVLDANGVVTNWYLALIEGNDTSMAKTFHDPIPIVGFDQGVQSYDFWRFGGQDNFLIGSPGAWHVAVTPIPEPEIYAMMGLGFGLLGWVGRRRKQQAVA